jgi:hypothetical protein
MTYDVGDRAEPTYELRDPAGQLVDATVSLAVTPPAAAEYDASGTVVHDGLGRYHGSVDLDTPGMWRWEFSAAGAAVEATQGALYVRSPLSALPWVPALSQVAALVPNRTLDQSGGTLIGGAFTANTVPTVDQAAELLDQSAAEVAGSVGAVDPSLHDMARSCAAMRTAGKVELAYPTDGGAAAGQTWAAQADRCLDRLVRANAAVGGSGPAGTAVLLPQWSFPDPVAWGDSTFL